MSVLYDYCQIYALYFPQPDIVWQKQKPQDYEDAGKVLNSMQKYDIHPGISTYNIRIQSLCKLKKSMEAKALLDGMLSRVMKPNSVTYCHLIHGFCKEGNLYEPMNLFKKMFGSGCQPDSDCYFTLVYFFCQSGDFETALQMICKENMEKGWVQNFLTMKSLVNGLASISKVDERNSPNLLTHGMKWKRVCPSRENKHGMREILFRRTIVTKLNI
ncbi:pentatricopeptide repeat-containing protein At1g61870, mitochondrial-like [Actinidia eriantha]|uniref:pentatricopeptide repeat-containing protein At1g61870, mitochondrial-like n=1 Tax=Actinidia eriantha TaxID=165200 RepID=UPI0025908FAC|nr:pentatricopeptide repeat-containing protein At1g61870, mitochondrial-like [Actinidia eriantha]